MESEQLMVDITHKNYSLRIATAQALVTLSQKKSLLALKENRVPKGDVFATAKAAALLAVKKTPELIPDCHPLPIEYVGVTFEIEDHTIAISVTVKTIYKTGVEVEAMHGASVAALTVYDMLKPLDKGIEIGSVKLQSKKGGKSDYLNRSNPKIRAAVIVCSDSVAAGLKEDRAGKAILEQLKRYDVAVDDYLIIPDEKKQIREKLVNFESNGANLVIYTGGTGLSSRDVTPEALEQLLERRIPGIEEAIRKYGQERTPYAMLSRSVAGIYKNTLVLALPGSTKGARESMQAIFPAVKHLFAVIKGTRHD